MNASYNDFCQGSDLRCSLALLWEAEFLFYQVHTGDFPLLQGPGQLTRWGLQAGSKWVFLWTILSEVLCIPYHSLRAGLLLQKRGHLSRLCPQSATSQGCVPSLLLLSTFGPPQQVCSCCFWPVSPCMTLRTEGPTPGHRGHILGCRCQGPKLSWNPMLGPYPQPPCLALRL